MIVFDSRKFVAVSALICLCALAVYAASQKDTPAVEEVVFNSSGQSLEVQIRASERTKFTYFELHEPRRLVVDFHGVRNNIGFAEKAVAAAGVERVRTSLFTAANREATRIVFDLDESAQYDVVNQGGGLVTVQFGDSEPQSANVTAPPPLTLSAGPPMVPPAETETETARVPAFNLETVTLAAEPPRAPLLTANVPAARAVSQINVAPPPTGTPLTTPPEPQQYTGDIYTFDLKDVDIKDFFRLIGEISGLNIVLDPNVTGIITIRLIDVPWDQALDVVLRNYQLGGQLQGNVLRIATNATLQAEENSRRALRDAQELAADLVTRTYVLNYTRADTVSGTLQRMLTSRGTIIQDARRNALIVSDIPGQFGRVDQMIEFLDQPAPQVEIEARLLSANKSFSRELGNQLGLLIGNRSGNVLTGGSGASSPFSRDPAPRATTGGSGLPLIANFPAAATSGIAFLMQAGGDILLDEIITAAEARGTAKLLSRPKVIAQNNQAATVSQGTQIPVQTNVNNTISVQFLQFALSLTVTPQITEAGTILMTVAIENSQPDFARAVNGIPSVATQQAQTQVLVPDGGTAVIGGILVDTDSLNIRQVPGLGSLPVIGHLFKNTQTIKSTTELLFFITPRIKPLDALNVSAPDEAAIPDGE